MIIYELNEVPVRLFEFYADAFPQSAFGILKSNARLFQTISADLGSLSPWVTWPTMHRGVSNIDHQISDLGQDIRAINNEFPNIYTLLADSGVNVGVFGCLHSYPLPEDISNYSFYVPDTFAAGPECFPGKISPFQRFNLSMVAANGRNVSRGIALGEAKDFVINARQMGLTLKTFGKLVTQVFGESLNKDRVVRRRTSQVEIAFDIFYNQLVEKRPEVCFFFTNHVASSMHRYWPTIFPKDYLEGKFDRFWLERWKNEIPHAVKVANQQLMKLINYCRLMETELVVCSSMGQAAVESVSLVENQVLITNLRNLMSFLGLSPSDWEPRLSMAPLVVIKPNSSIVLEKLKILNDININGKRISYFLTSSGDIRLEIKVYDVEKIVADLNGTLINPRELGLEVIHLQDAANANAYHVPEGILMHYSPKSYMDPIHIEKWKNISALDFAPSLLGKFSIDVPSYMSGDTKLF